MSQTKKVISQIVKTQNIYSYMRYIESLITRRKTTKQIDRSVSRTTTRKKHIDQTIDALIDTIDPEILRSEN